MPDIIARIPRYKSEANREQEREMAVYRVPYRAGLTLQNLLRHIYEEMDQTLAFRDYHCGYGWCGACRVKLNGKTVRACMTLVKANDDLLVEPLSEDDVIRDLATRMKT